MKLRLTWLATSLVCLLSGLRSPAQSISSFNPPLGTTNTQVEILGSGFIVGTTRVYFNNKRAAVFVDTSSRLIATITNGTPLGTGAIGIQNPPGITNFSLQNFTVIGGGPYITNVTPNVGSAGSVFLIEGVQFFTGGFTPNISSIRLNNTNVAGFFIQTQNRVWVTNNATPTTGFITLISSKGNFTNTSLFYIAPIAINSVSPTNGSAGTSVTLTGQNLLGVTNVQFGGVVASFTPPTNNSTLHTEVPIGAISGPIRVATPAGVQFSSAFRVLPTVTGFTPGKGALGTNVVITGANLNEGLSSVKFNGVSATFGTPVFGQVTATVPNGATTGPISITTSNGTFITSSNFYLPPIITAITPSNAPALTFIKVSGTNFTDATSVTFNGAVANFVVTNNNTIGAEVPINVTTGPIAITTPYGTTNSGSRLFYGVPDIVAFTPDHGLPGTNVVILGTNFLGATAVRFTGTNANGVNASFTIVHNGRIEAVVPTNAQTGAITVITPGGTNVSADVFTLDYSSDLAVTITDNPDPLFVTSNLIYTVQVVNNGPSPANNVVLTNLLPSSVTLLSVSSTHGSVVTNFPTVQANIGTLNPGVATVVLSVRPQIAGDITNKAGAFSSIDDPNLTNNIDSELTTVWPTPLLSISVTPTNRIRLAWPAVLSNFSVQFSTNLSTNAWTTLSNTLPFIISNQSVVIQTNTGTNRFFRLKQ